MQNTVGVTVACVLLVAACRTRDAHSDAGSTPRPFTTQDLIAAATAKLPPELFPSRSYTMSEDVDHRRWRRFLTAFKGWDVVNASAPLSTIVSGGNYAVLYVQPTERTVEDGTAFVVIDRDDTSHVVALMDRGMDDPARCILFP